DLRYRFTQLAQRRQLGLAGTLPEGVDRFAQALQRAFARLVAPLAQQLLTVQQGVDMVAQMTTQQLRGMGFAAGGATRLGLAEAVLLQGLHSLLEGLGAWQGRVGRAVQLRQALLQQ